MIKVSQSSVDIDEVEAVKRILLEDGYFGMGQEVRAFEADLKSYFGSSRDVACVNTGTAALHLAVMSCVQPGEEVLVQSLTYVASFQAISAAGAVPVACEVDSKTLTIDLADAEKRLTSKTRAIMPVHYMGDPGSLDQIYAFAQKHKLRVIEDAAHAFGSTYQQKRIGSFGDVVCFSFDSIKNITSGEGGLVVSDDEQVMTFVKDARLLGVQKDTQKRFEGKRSWEFQTTHQGYRYHMSNICAAIGRVQLKKFSQFAQQRQTLAAYYQELLSGIEGLECIDHNYAEIVPHIYVLRIQGGRRDALRAYLAEQGIECGVHYYPNHLLDFYQVKEAALPATEVVYSEILTVPLHCQMSKPDVESIVSKMRTFVQK